MKEKRDEKWEEEGATVVTYLSCLGIRSTSSPASVFKSETSSGSFTSSSTFFSLVLQRWSLLATIAAQLRANAGRWDVDAGRIGRRHDGLILGPAVMEMVHSIDEERPSVSLRNFTAAPARLPLRLALQVRGQQEVVDQITSVKTNCAMAGIMIPAVCEQEAAERLTEATNNFSKAQLVEVIKHWESKYELLDKYAKDLAVKNKHWEKFQKIEDKKSHLEMSTKDLAEKQEILEEDVKVENNLEEKFPQDQAEEQHNLETVMVRKVQKMEDEMKNPEKKH
ncbi:hypothetical protein F7725_028746 [Dissostichus mawsoni]|uniref:Uncharacterized protein n=1 Tax=Dissostichus mawsoni TaxID=36200 RepID=A0A7J5XJ21_DISMA|nr:hypothetical protein F7725_028746 [Dissostichus mawsoni]